MIPEKKRAPHQSGRGKGNVSQIQGHLCDKTADELLTELEARMDEMTDLTYDEDVIDSYLAALDKKAPLEKDFDVERSWEKFRSQHAILFDEDISPKPEVPQRGSHGFRFRRAFARVVVVAAIVAVFTMFCAQAAGIDVFGAIGRWTEETFRFAAPAGPATSAVSAVPVDIDGVLIYEVEQYPRFRMLLTPTPFLNRWPRPGFRRGMCWTMWRPALQPDRSYSLPPTAAVRAS